MILLEQQKLICQKYQSSLQPLDSKIIAVALDTVGQMPINGLRYSLNDGENISWYIYCGEYSDNDNFFQPVHLSHLTEILPNVLPYLALEANFAFVIDDKDYEDVYKFQ